MFALVFSHQPDGHPGVVEVAKNHRDAHARHYLPIQHLGTAVNEKVAATESEPSKAQNVNPCPSPQETANILGKYISPTRHMTWCKIVLLNMLTSWLLA